MNALELEQLRGDRRTKQIIVATMCGIAALFSMTVCVLVLRGMGVPEALDRLITFVVGLIGGMLTKTGVERPQAPSEPVAVTTPPGQPLETTTVDDEPAEDTTAAPTDPLSKTGRLKP